MIAVIAATLASTSPVFPAAAPPRTVTADAKTMLALGQRYEAQNAVSEAQLIYAALEADPDADIRSEARFRLAQMAIAQGSWSSAALLLRRVLDDKPDAAPVRLTLAKVLTEIGDEGAALRELRAAQASGLPLEVARMVDRFSEALRARRPFGLSVELALAPDSNINTATSNDRLGTVIGDFDIDPGGKARSGTGAAVRASLFGRRRLGDRLAVLARGSVSADLYRDRDFNQVTIDAALGPELNLGPVRINVGAGATRRWYGMKPFEDSYRLEANGAVPTGRRSITRARLSLAKIDNQFNDLQDGRVLSGELGIERALDSRTGVGLSLSAARARLADPGYSTISWRAGAVGWREVGRMTLTAAASYGHLEADQRLSLFPDKREDESWRVSGGVTMRQLQFGGFAPLVRVSYERNASTIAFYDYRRRRVEFGVARAF